MVYKNPVSKSSIITLTFTTIFFLFLIPGQSIKFTLEIPGLERQCFYEVMNEGQKYSMQTIPKNHPKYQIQISQSNGGQWVTQHYKMANIGYQRMQIHKLALGQSTYAFCIKNIERDLLQISVKFQTGVQLLEFQLLPDKSDTQNLDRQITWLEGQKSNLYQIIKKIEEKKIQNSNNSALLSTKMILFAVIGLVSIVVVNFLFFKEMKNVLHRRKLI